MFGFGGTERHVGRVSMTITICLNMYFYFKQFLEGRLALVAARAGCSDEFARECCAWEEHQKLRKRWKRKPAQILKNLKNKVLAIRNYYV